MAKNKFLSLVFLSMISSSVLFAQDGGVYDVELTKERVKKIHGDFVLKLQGDWKSSLEGRVEAWQWTPKGWKCGSKDEHLACASWSPVSFDIFSKNFWANWTPVRRESFEVIKAGVERAKIKPAEKAEGSEEAVETGSPEASSAAPIWGRNTIGELWVWKNNKGEELKLFLSARDSRIDRLEFRGQTEILEWAPASNRKSLELSKLIIEKDGTQAVVSRK